MLAIMTEPMPDNKEIPYTSLHYLRALLGDDPHAVNDILREIKSQWKEDASQLSAAMADHDINEMKRLLHRVKSTFSPLGPGHVLYHMVLDKGEAFLEKRGTLDGDDAYWNMFLENINTLVNNLKPEPVTRS